MMGPRLPTQPDTIKWLLLRLRTCQCTCGTQGCVAAWSTDANRTAKGSAWSRQARSWALQCRRQTERCIHGGKHCMHMGWYDTHLGRAALPHIFHTAPTIRTGRSAHQVQYSRITRLPLLI